MANSWINYFRNESRQLVYRYNLSLSKNENMFKKNNNNKAKLRKQQQKEVSHCKPQTIHVRGQRVIYCPMPSNGIHSCEINYF